LNKLTIDKLRERFEPLSLTMLGIVTNFGHVGEAPLYRAFCPMAFDNKGAPWLQADHKIANPYFGAKMFACGKIERTFEPSLDESTKDDAPDDDKEAH
jgi:Cu(I)/Ag(I) efflux system membrane fusion protein